MSDVKVGQKYRDNDPRNKTPRIGVVEAIDRDGKVKMYWPSTNRTTYVDAKRLGTDRGDGYSLIHEPAP